MIRLYKEAMKYFKQVWIQHDVVGGGGGAVPAVMIIC